MKKSLVLCVLVVLSSQVRASGLCAKYVPFKNAIQFGDPQAEKIFYSTCPAGEENKDACSDIKMCLADIFTTVSMAKIQSPRSAETLEKVGFDIGLKDSSNADAVDRAASTCAAEDLFFLRAYGADRVIDKTRSAQLIKSIHTMGERIPKFTQRCAQAEWVMSLPKKDFQNLVADKSNVEAAHEMLKNDKHFSDVLPDNGHTTLDLISFVLETVDGSIALKLTGLPSKDSFDILLASNGLNPKTSPRMSQVDRMLFGLLQLKSDTAGIFAF